MSGFTEARELKERVRTLQTRQQEILATAETEDRDLNSEEQTEWDGIHDQQVALGKRAKRIVDHEDRQKEIAAEMEEDEGLLAGDDDRGAGDDPNGRTAPGGENRDAVNKSMAQFFLGEAGAEDLDTLRNAGFDIRKKGKELHLDLMKASSLEQVRSARRENRAMGTPDNAGGETIPQTLIARIERALLEFGGMREAGTTILRTSAGEKMTMPTSDDTSNSGRLLAENTQVTETTITTAEKELDAYKYSSDLVLVSNELLTDSAIDMPSFIGDALGERIGRITNQHFTTGTGSSQPNGVVTAASSAATTANPTVVSTDELNELEHAVDPAYRKDASVGWMFSDQTLKVLKQMKDGDGRPLWVAGVAVREPDTINGYRYTVNQDVADIAASAKAILFGAFKWFWIRDVLGIRLLRLDERYADYDQVGWVAFSRHDSELMSAGAPIKYLTQSA